VDVAGTTHSAAVLFITRAGTRVSPNAQAADDVLIKERPCTTTVEPPAVLAREGDTPVTTSASAYRKDSEPERSSPAAVTTLTVTPPSSSAAGAIQESSVSDSTAATTEEAPKRHLVEPPASTPKPLPRTTTDVPPDKAPTEGVKDSITADDTYSNNTGPATSEASTPFTDKETDTLPEGCEGAAHSTLLSDTYVAGLSCVPMRQVISTNSENPDPVTRMASPSVDEFVREIESMRTSDMILISLEVTPLSVCVTTRVFCAVSTKGHTITLVLMTVAGVDVLGSSPKEQM